MVGNIDSFVVDASFVLANLLPDEKSPESDRYIIRFRNQELKLFSSSIFNLEVLNGLKSAKLSKRIDDLQCFNIAKTFMKIGIVCEEVDDYESFLIAQKSNLSVYDATYVWLARSRNVPLLSLDKRMQKLASK